MALIHEGTNALWESVLDAFNLFFTCVFIIEAILKLIAYGGSYFRTAWNKFDFIIVISSIIDILIGLVVDNKKNSSSMKLLKVAP